MIGLPLRRRMDRKEIEAGMADVNDDPEKDHAGVPLPPPVIFVGIFALALIVDWAADGPSFALPFLPRLIAAAILLFIGLASMIIAGAQFNAQKTNIPPWKPATVLVTTGIYRYSRNPMYLGMAVIYAALSLFADSVVSLLCLPAVLVILFFVAIKREEHYLEVKFGQDYRDYKARARRWL